MSSFQEKLAAHLGAREMGFKTLARLIDPENVEQARRAVRRWAKGTHVPSQANRDAISDALGLERGSLDPDDEEESRMYAHLASQLRVVLTDDRVLAELGLRRAA